MSLIICSSTQDEYLRKNRSGDVISSTNGLSNPASFSNNFRSPLLIPKDAEVAVESVKINRSPLFDIPDESLFYFYHGPELTGGVVASDVTKIPVPIRIPRGAYTVDSLRAALEDTLNKSNSDPETFGNYVVTINRETTTNEFRNFLIKTVRKNTKSAITFTGADGEIRPANDVTDAVDFNWNGTTFTNIGDPTLNPFAFDCVAQLPQYPLASVSGVLEVNFSGTTVDWTVGLSRMRIPEVNRGQPLNCIEPLKQEDTEPLIDYSIEYNDDTDEIGVFHALPDENGKLRFVEIDYPSNAPDFSSKINASKISASGLNSVRFTLIGNALQLDIGTQGGTFYPLVSTTNASMTSNTDRRYNFKPTSNTTESLFPVFALFGQNDSLDLTTYEGRNLTSVGWNVTTTGERFTAGSDFYSSNIKSGKGIISHIDNKKSLRQYSAELANFSYKGLNASNAIDYNVVMIGGAERDLSSTNVNRSETATYVIPYTQRANMGTSLGFGDYAVLEQSIFATAGSTPRDTTIEPPVASSLYTNECFIRANNLTGTSYNGAKNSISRILYSLPRFDNAGNTVGNLYFQASEKTYIKLNNTHELTLNQLDIDLVDRSERIVKDLTGNTIVILYVRKSSI